MELKPGKIYRAVLVYPIETFDGKPHICLPFKLKKIGVGRRNGYGGGIEDNETEREAAARKLWEKGRVSAAPCEFELHARCTFTTVHANRTHRVCEVDVFHIDLKGRQLQATSEMSKPEWFLMKREHVPLHQLMEADKYWVPLMVAGHRLFVGATYGPNQSTLIGPVRIRSFYASRGERKPISCVA